MKLIEKNELVKTTIKKNDNQIWLKKEEEVWKPILIFNLLKPQLGLRDHNNHIEREKKKKWWTSIPNQHNVEWWN